MSKHLVLLSDIARIVTESDTIAEVLQRVVQLVAGRLGFAVCTIWMLDDAEAGLELAATEGLNPDAIGKARLERGEGLSWATVEAGVPVAVADVWSDPRFHHLPLMREEEIKSFLGLPLLVRRQAIGAIVVQTRERHVFSKPEIAALTAIASQVAPVVNEARVLRQIAATRPPEPEPEPEPHPSGPGSSRTGQGIGCSSGVVSGPAICLESLEETEEGGTPGSVAEELELLKSACAAARADLIRVQEWLYEHDADEAVLIFAVQLMMLEDSAFVGRMRAGVEAGLGATAAIELTRSEFVSRLSELEDPVLRERADDVRDLASRLRRHVSSGSVPADASLAGCVAVLESLTPSALVSLSAEGVIAVIAAGGASTSHAALLARSLGLPLVAGLGDFVHELWSGQQLLVDARAGTVVTDPPIELSEEARRLASFRQERLDRLREREIPSDLRLSFKANVSLWSDAQRALEEGAEGVGLYRTEFAFLMRPDIPAEEEQYLLYRRVVEAVQPHPVTIRVLDAGGDKLVPGLNLGAQANPFLGYRSLRLLLDNPDILVPHVRAIHRALEGTSGRILLPMVSGVDELRAFRTILAREGLAGMPVGAMIEVPSALWQLPELAREADFLSIGTNDLCQHLLAVDRTNERVTRFFDPCHSANIRAIHAVAVAAKSAGKSLDICGEMASEPLYLPLWLSLGVAGLSVHVDRIRLLRVLAAPLDADEACAALEKILQLDSASAIRAELTSLATPDALEFIAKR